MCVCVSACVCVCVWATLTVPPPPCEGPEAALLLPEESLLLDVQTALVTGGVRVHVTHLLTGRAVWDTHTHTSVPG